MEDHGEITDWTIKEMDIPEEDDDELYENDPYYFDDNHGVIYDVTDRLKEINAALSLQVIPEDHPNDGRRRVKFHDNPVAVEIPPDTHFGGSSEEEEVDDGYGDSTEVSDEPEDCLPAELTTTSTPTSSSSINTKVIEKLAMKLAELVSFEAIKHSSNINVTENNKKMKANGSNDVIESSSLSTLKKELTESCRLETRRSSKLPIDRDSININAIEEETMVMSSNGKFHVVQMDEICRTSSAAIILPRVTTLPKTLESPKKSINRPHTTTSSLQKLRQAYMGSSSHGSVNPQNSNKRVMPKNDDYQKYNLLPVGRRRPSTGLISNAGGIQQRVQDDRHQGGRIGYGLTDEQKKERERKLNELASQRRFHQERQIEETRQRKERGEVAFREWLRLKKTNSKPNQSQTRSSVQNPPLSNGNIEKNTGVLTMETAFDRWLHQKRLQKEEDQRLESLRRFHEQEFYCKKTREEIEKAFQQWLQKKTRHRTRRCLRQGIANTSSYHGHQRVGSPLLEERLYSRSRK